MCPTSASRKLKSLPFLSLSSIFPLTWFSASPSSATDWMADWLALPLKSRSSEWNYLIYILYCKLSWFWLLFRRATNKERSRHKFPHHLYDTATPRKGTGCHQQQQQPIHSASEWMDVSSARRLRRAFYLKFLVLHKYRAPLHLTLFHRKRHKRS